MSERAASLRAAFDGAFARAAEARRAEGIDALAVRLGGEACALRIADLAGLLGGRRVVPVRTRAPHCLGLAGVRGGLVPVYALAPLAGVAGPPEPPRWLAVLAGDEPVAVAFAVLEGWIRLDGGPGLRRVLDLPSIAASLTRKER